MTVEVDVGGRRYRIELERSGQQWTMTVNGRSVAVDAARTAAGWSLLIDGETGARRDSRHRASYDVALDEKGAGDAVVSVNGHAIAARVVDLRTWRRDARREDAANGSRLITSAMPGRIVKVLVTPGARVVAGQALIVVEAMKMENELRAPGDAIVRDVKVSEGALVDAGAILIVLE